MDTNKQKLTDTQLRILQIVAGIISAAALFLAIYLPSVLIKNDENNLLNYAFVVVFLVIMMGRRSIENKYRLRLNLFSLTLMDGILGAVIIFATLSLYSGNNDALSNLSDTVKILIIVGLSLLLLIAGILVPLLRYFKRKANGTLSPIRLPEKPEPEETSAEADEDGPMTIEQKVAAMTRELEENKAQETDEKKDEE